MSIRNDFEDETKESLMMRVQNVDVALLIKLPSKYTSWIEYWQEYTHHMAKPHRCRCCLCYFNDTNKIVGAQVQKIINYQVQTDFFYIVPLCDACYHSSNHFSFVVNAADLAKIEKKFFY